MLINNKRKLLLFNLFLGAALLFLGMLPQQVLSAKKTFPGGCRQEGFSFKHYVLMLHPDKAGKSHSLYFIHNKLLKPVRFFQMRSGDEPYVMHLNNHIRPNQWGVFSTDEEKVRFICTLPDRKSSYGRIADCKNVIELCEYTNAKFSINNHGNHWAVRSSSRRGAINNAIWQGILLKW